MKVIESSGSNRTGIAIGVFVALVIAAVTFADPPNTPRARSYAQPAPASASSIITPSTDISPRSVTTPFVDAGFVLTPRIQLNDAAPAASLTGTSGGTIETGNGGTVGNLSVWGLLKTFNDFGLVSNAYDDGVDIGSIAGRFRILNLSRAIYLGGSYVFSGRAPTISSGFGTSPSIVAGRGVAFRLDVGTGGTASSGVVGFADTVTTGYICNCTDVPAVAGEETIMTATSTTTCTLTHRTIATGLAAAWAASADVWCTGTGY